MLRRLRFLLTRRKRFRELDEEISQHLELREAANRRRGLGPSEAARSARLRFGNPQRLREESMDVWRLPALEGSGRDLRQGIRRLHQQPGRSLVVAATLALGIGATTAMFSLVDAMLLAPAPWDTTGRLAWIVGGGNGSQGASYIPYSDYLAFRDRTTTLSGLAAEDGAAMAVGTAEPQRVLGGLVSGTYFELLGLRPAVGRTILPADDAAGAAPVAVLSYALWRDQFSSSPSAVGARLRINGQPFTVIGVAPPGFTGAAFATNPMALWIPIAARAATLPPGTDAAPSADRTSRVRVIGRIAEGVSVATAAAEMQAIAGSLDSADAPPDQRRRVDVVLLRGGLTPWEQDDLGPTFQLLALVPLVVLCVACANVANVLLAYHQGRRRELAMRRAIGATRGRLIRQLLAESLVLALAGALAGTATAWLMTRVVVALGEVPVDFAGLLQVNSRALLAATGVAVTAVIVFGLTPAIVATRLDVLPILKDEGTTATTSRGARRLRGAFVVAQVALALTLLVVAGLFLQSLFRTLAVDPGFDARGLAIVQFDTGLLRYTPERRAALAGRFLDRAAVLPGVTSVAAADLLPLGGVRYGATLRSGIGTSSKVSVARVSPTYFDTLGLPLLRGRTFTDAEAAARAPVAIVSASAARTLWPAAEPLGQLVRTDDPEAPAREVVGVARDSKWLFLDETPTGQFYVPVPLAAAGAFVARSSGDPHATLTPLKEIARSIDPDLPVTQAQTMEDRIHRSVNLRRALVSLLGVLGLVTLLLASVGIYGVAAHGVSTRTREVGIRLALGAHAGDVLRLIVREQLRMAFVGILIGLALSAAGAGMLSSFLFGVSRGDASVFLSGALILCSVAALASYLPARRAARLDPLRALRHE